MDKKDKQLEFLRGMEKLKSSDVRSPDYTSPLDQDVIRVKGPEPKKEDVTRIKNVTQKISTKPQNMEIISGKDFRSKIESLLKGGGKKAIGALPIAGALGAALSGDPAMAAEELVMDIPGMEAIRSDSAGMSPEDEANMLAEIDALKAYDKSPARMDKLRSLMQRSPASADIQEAQQEINKIPVPDFTSNIPAEKFDEERRKVFDEKEALRRLLEKQRG